MCVTSVWAESPFQNNDGVTQGFFGVAAKEGEGCAYSARTEAEIRVGVSVGRPTLKPDHHEAFEVTTSCLMFRQRAQHFTSQLRSVCVCVCVWGGGTWKYILKMQVGTMNSAGTVRISKPCTRKRRRLAGSDSGPSTQIHRLAPHSVGKFIQYRGLESAFLFVSCQVTTHPPLCRYLPRAYAGDTRPT